MERKTLTASTCITGIAVAIAVSFAAYGSSGHDEKQHTTERAHRSPVILGEAGNPLVDEMMALDAVFREVVSGVAVGDGGRVYDALEEMHGTMEKTHEGVSHGTVMLKRNADHLKEFIEQDKQFHRMLEELAGAARKNDDAAMLSLTKKLLDACARCHQDFKRS